MKDPRKTHSTSVIANAKQRKCSLTSTTPSIKTNTTIQNYINKKLTQPPPHTSPTPLDLPISVNITTSKYKKSTSSKELIHRKDSKQRTNSHSKTIEVVPQRNPQKEPLNELEKLREENKELKLALTKANKRILHLEKKLRSVFDDNLPKDKTKCPKPMPYVNKCYDYPPNRSECNNNNNTNNYNSLSVSDGSSSTNYTSKMWSYDMKDKFNDSIQELSLNDLDDK